MRIGKDFHRRAKGEMGFTLIELIVVVAVLGVLATLVMPKVINVKKDAETATNKVNETIIRNALERYYAEHGEYPESLKSLEGDYLDKDYSDEWAYKKTGENSYDLKFDSDLSTSDEPISTEGAGSIEVFYYHFRNYVYHCLY